MRKVLATAVVAMFATVAFGAITANLVPNHTVPTQGADLATFQRDVTHFTFDLVVSTDQPWTGSEVEVIVGPPAPGDPTNGIIWHATDQMNMPFMWDLGVPMMAPAPPADTRLYDTFLAAPGADFFVNASPGISATGWIISTPTWIASNPQGIDPDIDNSMPLAWFATGAGPLVSQMLGRFTFYTEGPELTLDPVGAVFATITGINTESGDPTGLPFAYTIYQVPEPAGLALLALGGLALIRRR